ncbi:DUF5994 family protein [Hoyosella sp. YIM 151337]|uniref:DUF5994 family protein n=1 Tax=Hoyosella sp. YIM 151337 TaxID=2992742 RepID=UPI002236746C|nr:DUF5994 family protein [Hoyosella sp. YIM 151337]MCW4352878.1 DUF5994 family protein [Hoyosella sp. YIM 151337]
MTSAHETPARTPREFGVGHMPKSTESQPFRKPSRTPRLQMQAGDRTSGQWRPFTTNLVVELHDLIAALSQFYGPIERVVFDWSDHDIGQRAIGNLDDVAVDGPEPDQPANTMYLYSTTGLRIQLTVEPPISTR